MKKKKKRIDTIIDILQHHVVRNQEELLRLLRKAGYDTTQATLSRDLKALNAIKTPLANGDYKYSLPTKYKPLTSEMKNMNFTSRGVVTGIEFSGQFAVIKTRPGYANVIATEIDQNNIPQLIGTIAGDDTVLLITQDNTSRENISHILRKIFIASSTEE